MGWVRIGEQSISVAALPDELRELANGTDIVRGFRVPALASFKNGQSIAFKILNHEQLIGCNKAVQNIIFRILATTPPAKVLFTFIDPIGQGQNVASFLSLSDYNESLVNIKAWTDSRQIEQRLSVTQKRRSLWDGVFYWRGISEHTPCFLTPPRTWHLTINVQHHAHHSSDPRLPGRSFYFI